MLLAVNVLQPPIILCSNVYNKIIQYHTCNFLSHIFFERYLRETLLIARNSLNRLGYIQPQLPLFAIRGMSRVACRMEVHACTHKPELMSESIGNWLPCVLIDMCVNAD